eukprot:CAMPEP_0171056782 /NCGR_PEP_ID=MMETSP0766_2-20121228/1309_1 /TAXON_ID=439317 /ORGANISM="Gambierdiscus australes, Strain CAWD 149" /LENGTH=263 /DNA_ID=CAMNT_0011511771 /DNA_START=144 /DNA_END=935 /DNA_ORIENTATION=+
MIITDEGALSVLGAGKAGNHSMAASAHLEAEKGEHHFAVNSTREEVVNFAARSVRALRRHAKEEGSASGGGYLTRVLFQFLFGLVYFYLIVTNYPALPEDAVPPPEAVALQEANEVSATCQVSPPNCILAWCCSGPRAAHTFHTVGIGMNYWIGLVLMTFFPCCTLFAVNSFTQLNERLGGQKRNPVMSCVCAFFCSCCVIAQDAEALDLVSGHTTGFCGVAPAKSGASTPAQTAPAEAGAGPGADAGEEKNGKDVDIKESGY